MATVECEYVTVGVRKETKEGPIQNAKKAVADEIGHDPSYDQLLRELCRAYTGVEQ